VVVVWEVEVMVLEVVVLFPSNRNKVSIDDLVDEKLKDK
jgi:hypothetical protein